MSNTAEVIIIGAGVHGASLAFHLAERGVKALVLEKSFIGAGATGRSSGLVRMHYDVELDSRLAWESYKYFANWKQRIGGDCGFTKTGFLQFVAPKYLPALKANVEMHEKIGIPVSLITAKEVKELAPYFYTEDIELAAYEPESGYAMPSDAAASMLTAAREKGARLIQDCSVNGIQLRGEKVEAVETSQGIFSTPIIVNATGPWADRINKMAGLDLPYTTWQHDTMFVVRPKELSVPHPTVIDNSKEIYFRPEGELTLIGLEDGSVFGESADTDTNHAKKGFVERAIERICERIPLMENGRVHSAHGGYDGITPDQHPMIGAAGPDGFYLDCGFSGTGFKIAPVVGLCMAEIILDGHSHSVDISSFSPKRFLEGKTVMGNYDMIWR